MKRLGSSVRLCALAALSIMIAVACAPAAATPSPARAAPASVAPSTAAPGAASAPDAAGLTPPPSSAPPSAAPAGLTREQAIAAALAASPGWTAANVRSVELGTFGSLGWDGDVLVMTRPAPDAPVWRVSLAQGDEGMTPSPTGGHFLELIIGADGAVIQRSEVFS